MNHKIDDATTPEEMQHELVDILRDRVKMLSITNQNLVIAMQEICDSLGLILLATPPAVIAREVANMCKDVDRLKRDYTFYKKRCEALQRWQSRMRNPERTVVCDILANGFTIDQATDGDRYGGMKPNDS